MYLQKALKYAIWRKKFEILRTLDTPAERDDDDSDESESDNNNVFESDSNGIEILKKLDPTVICGESENDEVFTNKEIGFDSNPHNNFSDYFKGFGLETQTPNPFIEYYDNQALTGQRQPEMEDLAINEMASV